MSAIRQIRPSSFPGYAVSTACRPVSVAKPATTLVCRWIQGADGRLTCFWECVPTPSAAPGAHLTLISREDRKCRA
jgi:hypothetical protein